jgi:hypothetical protein
MMSLLVGNGGPISLETDADARPAGEPLTLGYGVVAHLDWNAFTTAGRGLFLWEAFVTSAAKAATHADDAMIAAEAFIKELPVPLVANAGTAERPYPSWGPHCCGADGRATRPC